jgi:hypothetical protein
LSATRNWFVLTHKITKPSDLDPTKKFTDYNIEFVTFLQFCDYMAGQDDGTPTEEDPGAVNQALANEGCKQRVTMGPVWRQKHQGDVISDFVIAVVDLILEPPAAGV